MISVNTNLTFAKMYDVLAKTGFIALRTGFLGCKCVFPEYVGSSYLTLTIAARYCKLEQKE